MEVIAIAKREFTQARYEANNRYLEKNYTAITVRLPKDTVEEFKDKCTSVGVSQRQVILNAITDFLRDE